MRDSEDRRDGSVRGPSRNGIDGGAPARDRERSAPGGRRLPAARSGGDDRSDRRRVTDPVKSRFAAEYDLYDVATWEVRSSLDRLAVSVAGWLRTARKRLLVGTALVLFLGQVLVAGPSAFPELPEGAEDLLHILDAEERAIDRETAGERAAERFRVDAAQALDDGAEDRIATLVDISYELEAWGGVDLADVRERID